LAQGDEKLELGLVETDGRADQFQPSGFKEP
jgi:hypothetical protein